ncbi:transcriptional regulator of various polyols utilization, AraC family [Lachnospiraceae bacterium KM106-2]|nr:transcriptional regulator of various polyols utilization, AraC family [Lachnospiraceae bacterium KM106-2]
MINYDKMREAIPHGDAMFPLKVHEVVTDLEFPERLNCHWHDEIEFLVVTKGEAVFHINERQYQVKEGDVLFIHSNDLHSASAVNELPFEFFAVVFHTSFLDSCFHDSIQQKYLTPVYQNVIVAKEYLSSELEWCRTIHSLLCEIRLLFQEQSVCFELQIKARLLDIWSLFYAHAKPFNLTKQKDNDYRINRLKTVMTYLKDNYSSKITLRELASLIGLCEGQFCRFFKSMTRMSAMDYLNHYRIMQSITLLNETDKTITEIAGMCGFNNISYFNKLFLKYMHTTPSEVRRQKNMASMDTP